jgi:hypothetical protein
MSKDLTWQQALFILKDSGVKTIVIDYSGGGDDGQIDAISYFNKEGDEIKHENVDIDHDQLQGLCYPALEDIEDWYNNDGGNGEYIIDIETMKYDIVNNVNYMQQETYKHRGSLKTLMKKD